MIGLDNCNSKSCPRSFPGKLLLMGVDDETCTPNVPALGRVRCLPAGSVAHTGARTYLRPITACIGAPGGLTDVVGELADRMTSDWAMSWKMSAERTAASVDRAARAAHGLTFLRCFGSHVVNGATIRAAHKGVSMISRRSRCW